MFAVLGLKLSVKDQFDVLNSFYLFEKVTNSFASKPQEKARTHISEKSFYSTSPRLTTVIEQAVVISVLLREYCDKIIDLNCHDDYIRWQVFRLLCHAQFSTHFLLPLKGIHYHITHKCYNCDA